MLAGYGAVNATMPIEAYYAGVLSGEIRDTTLSMQIATGFEPRGLLPSYLNDPVCDNYAVLLILPASKEIREASRSFAMSYIRLETEIPGPTRQKPHLHAGRRVCQPVSDARPKSSSNEPRALWCMMSTATP